MRADTPGDGGPRPAIGSSVSAFVPLWIAGLGFLWWPVVAGLETARGVRPASRPVVVRLLRVLALVLTISLVANVLGGQVALGRAAGSALAILVWLSVAVVITRWSGPGTRPSLVLGLGAIGALQGLLSGVAALLHPSPMSTLTTLAGQVAGSGLGDSGVAAWLSHDLAYDDFFGPDEIVRSAGMMASAAWSGGFAGLAAVALAACARPVVRLLGGRWWLGAALLALNLVSVYLSYTRLTWVLTVLGLVAVAAAALARLVLGDRAHLALLPALLLGAAIYVVAPPLDVQALLTDADELRPDSSMARALSYTLGIDMTTGGDVPTQLFGFGAKPTVASLPYGVGSESTYVSLLVRGGTIALLVFVAALGAAFWVCLRRADWVGGLLLVLLAAHAVVEDLDVGTLTPLVLVAVLAAPARPVAEASGRGTRDGRPRVGVP
ncbi:hypothetical protein [Actinomycetospora aeridis]|uniref:O-antigen ligase-like membrane protein n=1 Tax=Actinomycetospora aeridis TaxID=3129231 RepID=A0ABU8N6H2_9PSEU